MTVEDQPGEPVQKAEEPVLPETPAPSPEEEDLVTEIIKLWDPGTSTEGNLKTIDGVLERAVARGLRDIDGFRIGVALVARLHDIDKPFILLQSRKLPAIVVASLGRITEEIASNRVVIARNNASRPTEEVGIDAETQRLAIYSTRWKQVDGTFVASTDTSYITPTAFSARRYRDERGAAWFEIEADGTVLRGREGEIVDTLSSLHKLTAADRKGAMAYLRTLPLAGDVATTLALEIFASDGSRRVQIRPVFARRFDGSEDTAALLASWYRPRNREDATRIWKWGRRFFVTPNQQLILCWTAGAPIMKLLDPSRLGINLEAEGESDAGKTHTLRAGGAIVWGIGGGPREYFGAGKVASSFRFDEAAAATNLGLLIDEASLDRNDRERARAAASGATSGRGRRDLTSRHYHATAVFGFARNSTADETDSSAAELHGDRRRRIRLLFEEEDRAAIAHEKASFEDFAETLTGGNTDPSGGGYALWRLREMTDEQFTALVDLARDRELLPDDRQAAIAVGAMVLGISPPSLPTEEEEDPAAELVLDAIRRDAVRAQLGIGVDPVAGMIRAVAADCVSRPSDAADIGYAFVTRPWLGNYATERRRAGSSSPFTSLSALRSLAPLTGQTPDQIYPRGRGAGHHRRVPEYSPPSRVAIVRLPTIQLRLPPARSEERDGGDL